LPKRSGNCEFPSDFGKSCPEIVISVRLSPKRSDTLIRGLAPGQLKSRRGSLSSPRRLHIDSASLTGFQELTAGKTLSILRNRRHSHRHRLAAAWHSLVRQLGPVLRRRRHSARNYSKPCVSTGVWRNRSSIYSQAPPVSVVWKPPCPTRSSGGPYGKRLSASASRERSVRILSVTPLPRNYSRPERISEPSSF